MKHFIKINLTFCLISSVITAQNIKNNPQSNHGNKFEQLGTILPTANEYRAGSGAPGGKYWQQKADYVIDATLDQKKLMLIGKEVITYHNNSNDKLSYLWVQLDENEHQPNSESNYMDNNKFSAPYLESDIKALNYQEHYKGLGDQILSVTDELGKAIPYTINQTMMRIDLPSALVPRTKIKFVIKWQYKISERSVAGARGGFEYFKDEDNYIFTMSQWYPRMCVYNDHQGWNNKQFIGRGEFALAFGDYNVKLTVPSNHIISATGLCQNYAQVLNTQQLQRWTNGSNKLNEITEIITLDECKKNEITKTNSSKTWVFKADSVRDFAWGASPKFMWDAMPIKIENKKILCMSFYSKEAYGLYRKFSTKTIAHTLKTYSKYTIPYSYPVAQSVEANNGMEYPMIAFNNGRTEKDGTYSEATKNGLISVVIHEVGHNFFPMIINSDERQWTWMDEGFNTFMQYLTEQEFDNNYPSNRGPAHRMVDYLKLPKDQLEPIMTNTENLVRFGPNAYGKTCTALNMLRETIMGRELFDFAFKQYAKRWAFKHPTPSDFFRTMEDASAVDLDWFWRAWFYDIEPVDISIDSVKAYKFINNQAVPIIMDSIRTYPKKKDFESISKIRNKQSGLKPLVDSDTTLRDFYYYNKQEIPTTGELRVVNENENIEAVNDSLFKDIKNTFYYQLHFTNKGGCVAPIIIQWNFKDGTSEVDRVNAYIWRRNEKNAFKTYGKSKEVVSILIDPFKETADIDEKNNTWNIKEEPSRFDLFKSKEAKIKPLNLMQKTAGAK